MPHGNVDRTEFYRTLQARLIASQTRNCYGPSDVAVDNLLKGRRIRAIAKLLSLLACGDVILVWSLFNQTAAFIITPILLVAVNVAINWLYWCAYSDKYHLARQRSAVNRIETVLQLSQDLAEVSQP